VVWQCCPSLKLCLYAWLVRATNSSPSQNGKCTPRSARGRKRRAAAESPSSLLNARLRSNPTDETDISTTAAAATTTAAITTRSATTDTATNTTTFATHPQTTNTAAATADVLLDVSNARPPANTVSSNADPVLSSALGEQRLQLIHFFQKLSSRYSPSGHGVISPFINNESVRYCCVVYLT
jgi:hypothetical protein